MEGTSVNGERAEVTWITDGDTIEVDTTNESLTVRLAGINAPDGDECFYEESLDYLIETLSGKVVELEVLEEDQFGRTLAHVFDGTNHVNGDLVARGLAIGNGLDDDPYGPEIHLAEDSAFDSRRGLWAPDACGHDGDLPDVTFDENCSNVDPSGPDDQNLEAERVCVSSSSDLDVSGWILRDESTRHRYRFDTSLSAGEPYEVSSSDRGWDPGGSPVWNNDGDMALLQLPDGTVVDRWRY